MLPKRPRKCLIAPQKGRGRHNQARRVRNLKTVRRAAIPRGGGTSAPRLHVSKSRTGRRRKTGPLPRKKNQKRRPSAVALKKRGGGHYRRAGNSIYSSGGGRSRDKKPILPMRKRGKGDIALQTTSLIKGGRGRGGTNSILSKAKNTE